jgi:hypothetical protein
MIRACKKAVSARSGQGLGGGKGKRQPFMCDLAMINASASVTSLVAVAVHVAAAFVQEVTSSSLSTDLHSRVDGQPCLDTQDGTNKSRV